MISYAAAQAERPASFTHAACQGKRSESVGAYRLLGNPNVTAQDILAGTYQETADLLTSLDEVLAIEDTTDLTFKRNEQVKTKRGTINKKSIHRKVFQHTVIALCAKTREVIGLLEQHQWERLKKDSEKGSKAREKRRSKNYKEKESYKWERASVRIEELLGEQMEKVISVCDREADVFEYLSYKVENAQRFVVRAAQTRTLFEKEATLFDYLPELTERFDYEVKITQSGSRKARTATLSVSSGKVALTRGKNYATSPPIEVNVVWAREIDPPEDDVKPLEWVLLTSEEIEEEEELLRVLGYYEARFICEEYHKALKTGCKAEERRLGDESLDTLLGLLAPIAIRILQLRDFSRREEEENCREYFDESEVKCLQALEKKRLMAPKKAKKTRKKGERKVKGKTPKAKQTIRWAVEEIARLAGWQDTKKDGKIGWQKLWEGYMLFQEIVTGWKLAMESED